MDRAASQEKDFPNTYFYVGFAAGVFLKKAIGPMPFANSLSVMSYSKGKSSCAKATEDKPSFAKATEDKRFFAKATEDKRFFAKATEDKRFFAKATEDKRSLY